MMGGAEAPRPIYLLKLVAPHGADARRLRWVLKALARQHGMRCVSIEVERCAPPEPINEHEPEVRR
jgi:hypothetical protein